MFGNMSIARPFFIFLTAVLLIVVAGFGYIWVSDDYTRFERFSTELDSSYKKFNMDLLRNEVDEAINAIEKDSLAFKTGLKERIKARVYEAHDIATNIYAKYQDSKNRGEIEALIREALRPILFNNAKGHYFAISLEGKGELFSDRPELEGKSLLDLQDGTGRRVVADMIALAD